MTLPVTADIGNERRVVYDEAALFMKMEDV